MFQLEPSVELNEMWTIPIFYSEISGPDISWAENRHNPSDIYIKYDQENSLFLFIGICCHWRHKNIYSNLCATLICSYHLTSQCQPIT